MTKVLTKELTIAVVDDHPIFRKGLEYMLETLLEDSRIWSFDTGQGLLEELSNIKPDIVFMDIDLKKENGIDICRQVKDMSPSIRVIMLSLYKDFSIVEKAFKNGANAYMVKENSAEELIECYQKVLLNIPFVSYLVEKNNAKPRVLEGKSGQMILSTLLTQSELRVLKLVSEKKSSREISYLLSITTKSIETYRSRICKKLMLDSRNNSLLMWSMENAQLIDQIKIE